MFLFLFCLLSGYYILEIFRLGLLLGLELASLSEKDVPDTVLSDLPVSVFLIHSIKFLWILLFIFIFFIHILQKRKLRLREVNFPNLLCM